MASVPGNALKGINPDKVTANKVEIVIQRVFFFPGTLLISAIFYPLICTGGSEEPCW